VALAPQGGRVASETPELLTFYLRLTGRDDLRSVSLSDRAALREFRPGDVVVVARGRRYFSNDALTRALLEGFVADATVALGPVTSTRIFVLDEASAALVSSSAGG